MCAAFENIFNRIRASLKAHPAFRDSISTGEKTMFLCGILNHFLESHHSLADPVGPSIGALDRGSCLAIMDHSRASLGRAPLYCEQDRMR